ncbi:MAG: VacJ family lipoprotein [Pseudomonadota bacterium]
MKSLPNLSVLMRLAGCFALLAALMGCAAPPPKAEVNDPFETQNRRIHEFNKSLDKNIVRPLSFAYGENVNESFRILASNFSSNLGLPGTILNNTLQGDLGAAAANSGRFILNTTIGIGGLADPAGEFGLREQGSDFGETLHVWGVGEGVYIESPIFGPSTTRDTVGRVVDFVIDPLNSVIKAPESYYTTGTKVASGLGTRYRFANTVDSILYESADSYAQSRLIYLQNRRFDLGQSATTTGVDTEGDIYDDLFFE